MRIWLSCGDGTFTIDPIGSEFLGASKAGGSAVLLGGHLGVDGVPAKSQRTFAATEK